MLRVQGKKELPGFKEILHGRQYGGNRLCKRVVRK